MSDSASHPTLYAVSGPACRRAGAAALAAAFALILSPGALALDWDIELVDNAINWMGGNVSIAVSDDGTPHIGQGSHSSQIMRYAVKQGSTWVIEEVDVYPSGLCVAADLDPDGNPCLAYLRWDSLIFARRIGGTWEHETVDLMHFDSHCALRIATDGTPHIAYCKTGDPWNLKYAHKPAATWLIETADPTVAAGNDIAMVLDDAGNPHIAHWAAPNYGAGPFQARYTRWDGSVWLNDIIDGTVENLNVFQDGIALDDAGNPHIAYFTHAWSTSSVRYAVLDGGNWTITTIDSGIPSSAACDLVLDRTGSPHVIFGTGYVQSGGSSELRYAYLDDQGAWVIEVIDTDGDAGELNSLAIDPQGYLHVAYFRGPGSGQDGEIRYARSTTPVVPNLGDMNCDGAVNAFDIDPFVLALTDPAGYAQAWPNCDIMNGDINGDGAVNAFDIDPFVELLTGP